MVTDYGRYALVFNGEIYNFRASASRTASRIQIDE